MCVIRLGHVERAPILGQLIRIYMPIVKFNFEPLSHICDTLKALKIKIYHTIFNFMKSNIKEMKKEKK